MRTATDWMRRYGDERSPAQIKRLPRVEMISTARRCCLLEHLSDAEIASMTVEQLRGEIDDVVAWMEGPC